MCAAAFGELSHIKEGSSVQQPTAAQPSAYVLKVLAYLVRIQVRSRQSAGQKRSEGF